MSYRITTYRITTYHITAYRIYYYPSNGRFDVVSFFLENEASRSGGNVVVQGLRPIHTAHMLYIRQ
jgi:hypothetical protein